METVFHTNESLCKGPDRQKSSKLKRSRRAQDSRNSVLGVEEAGGRTRKDFNITDFGHSPEGKDRLLKGFKQDNWH